MANKGITGDEDLRAGGGWPPVRKWGPTYEAEKAARRQEALNRLFLTGESLYETLIQAVDDLNRVAPPEHDVLVEAFGINVGKVEFVSPHTFLLSGWDGDGNKTSVVAHFSQLVTRVVYLPKKGKEKVITGFARVGKESG